MRKFCIALAAVMFVAGLAIAQPALADPCSAAAYQPVTGTGVGDYYVEADNWNGGAACVSSDGNADFAIQSQTAPATGNVLAYPDILAGCGSITGGNCTPGWANESVANLGTPKESWSVSGTTDPQAEYDVANDIWFAPNTAGCPDTELMIFINGQNLPAPSATVVTINGLPYYFKTYTATSGSGCSWHYVQFRRANSVTKLKNMPLMPFFKYAERQGLLSSNDYLRQMAAGYELWSYGAGLQTDSFSFTP